MTNYTIKSLQMLKFIENLFSTIVFIFLGLTFAFWGGIVLILGNISASVEWLFISCGVPYVKAKAIGDYGWIFITAALLIFGAFALSYFGKKWDISWAYVGGKWGVKWLISISVGLSVDYFLFEKYFLQKYARFDYSFVVVFIVFIVLFLIKYIENVLQIK